MMQDTNNKNQFYITQDVDVYTDNVDHLMDDLFGDVESTLHVDYAKLRSQKQKKSSPKQNQSPSGYSSNHASSSDIVAITRLDNSERELSSQKDTVSITKMNMADISLPPISKQDVLWIQPYIMRNPDVSDNGAAKQPNEIPPKYNLLDRLLLVLACSSALIAAVMWTINHGIWIGRQSVSVAQVSPQTPSVNNAFAEEIKRSLSKIVDQNRTIATNPNNPIGSTVPMMTAPLISTMPLAVGNQQQPMYVPVYQPPNLANGNNLPSPLALPPATANNAIELNNSANPSPIQKNSTTQAAATPPSAPAPSYTLIGVLDLGDRSTAMFDMDGSVQSIGLGKAISNTGWVLSRVSQQEIVIKRGKESRTVFVGQKF